MCGPVAGSGDSRIFRKTSSRGRAMAPEDQGPLSDTRRTHSDLPHLPFSPSTAPPVLFSLLSALLPYVLPPSLPSYLGTLEGTHG